MYVMLQKFKHLFPKSCSIIGMIHVDALPGTALYKGSIGNIIKKACCEAEIYARHSVDGVLIENMYDVPYLHYKYITSEIVSTMTRIGVEVRKILPENVPCGVQILAGGNKEAIAVAQACNFQFIRAEGFIFGHIADEGYMDGCAGNLLRYRKRIGAENISIYCDVKKKHSSHAITNDISLEDTAEGAEFFLADGVILTGKSTGSPTDVNDINRARSGCNLPIIIGSGVTIDNLDRYLTADALIVGSHFKKDGRWNSELCDTKIKRFMMKCNNKG